ncbi:MAG: nucleotidyltransferase domain-containing protein [Actinomycetota bacterium]|nr:nucleotidyltransferase domain-containing protein [Actinomycetota bacterium]
MLARVRLWASRRPDVIVVELAGFWSHGDDRMDSDVDILLLTTEKRLYLGDEAWARDLGGLRIVKTERWGSLTERPFVLPSGLEVEVGIAPPSWGATDPVDPGTRRVVEDGISIVYDPDGLLIRLLDACP